VNEEGSSLFWHRENITFGHGRILYVPAIAGWALPGGDHTTNRQRAYAVAVEIDRLTTEAAAQVKVTDQWPGVTLDRTMLA
jgi:hypothetical protein